MVVQEAISILKGLTNSKPLGGFSWLLAAQSIAEEIFAMDSLARLRQHGYLTTAAGTQEYSFNTLFGATGPRVRKLKGIYNPALTTAAATDYGRRRLPMDADQTDIEKRIYADTLVIEIFNDERKIVFASDPGTTTTTWKADYYLAAPTLNELSDLPVEKGWEHIIFITGMHAYWERARLKKSGPVRAEFEAGLRRYIDSLERDKRLRGHNPTQGYRPQTFVRPQ